MFCLIIFTLIGNFIFAPKLCICQPSNTKIINEYGYQQLAIEHFGIDTLFNFSPKKTYVLCTNKVDSSAMNPNNLTEFFVMKSDSGVILYEDKISGASISWKSDYELLIVIQKGIITSIQDSGKYSYVYDILTHLKKELKESSNIKLK